MNSQPQSSAWVINALIQCGIDIDRLTRALPREMGHLSTKPNQLRPDLLHVILNTCVTITDDANFGLHLSDYSDISAMGVYGYLLLNAETIGEFLELASAYYATLYQTGKLTLSQDNNIARLEYQVTAQSQQRQLLRHDSEWTIGCFINFLRERIGGDWHPNTVNFIHSQPEDISELQRRFGEHLFFDQPSNSFDIDTSLFDLKINDTDPKLLQLFRSHADLLMDSIADSDCFESHVRLLIMNELKNGPANATIVAKQLGMSLSSFQRRLKKVKCSFRSLRDEVVIKLAQNALIDTDINISIIALQVGYSELSAFDHAFTRICDMTPREYRKKYQH